jgi:hypothetical protein
MASIICWDMVSQINMLLQPAAVTLLLPGGAVMHTCCKVEHFYNPARCKKCTALTCSTLASTQSRSLCTGCAWLPAHVHPPPPSSAELLPQQSATAACSTCSIALCTLIEYQQVQHTSQKRNSWLCRSNTKLWVAAEMHSNRQVLLG